MSQALICDACNAAPATRRDRNTCPGEAQLYCDSCGDERDASGKSPIWCELPGYEPVWDHCMPGEASEVVRARRLASKEAAGS